MTFKLVRKPTSPKILHYQIRQEIINALKPVAKSAVESREKVVSNWRNKPKFKAETTVTTDRIEIKVTVRRGARLQGGSATVNDLWKWIDKTGTKPHIIRPKRPGGVLRFPGGKYQSKTGARPARYGGPGVTRPGDPIYRPVVNHPGFEPRGFTEIINADLKKKFDQAVDGGYRRGFRKISGR